jgi:signal peptide peptidase SppA
VKKAWDRKQTEAGLESNLQLRYPHIAARVFNTPLLVHPAKLNAILGVLGPRLGFEAPTAEGEEFIHKSRRELDLEHYMANMGMGKLTLDYSDKGGYYVANGNTAIIPIMGSLVMRSDWMMEMSGMTSYARIEGMLAHALDNPDVKNILLEIDSPGGEVAGAFDLADRIFEARARGKPITAVASETAASAAYLLASAANEIVVPRTASVGSVGVVAAHMDYSKKLEKQGVAVTLMYAGEKKVDGNPYQPLPDSVKAEWLAEIRDVYSMFVETVARNMGMSADKVRSTEAGMFMGSKAVDAGMAHRVNTFANELNNAVIRSSGGGTLRLSSTESRKEVTMDKQAAVAENTITAEDVTKARAEGAKAERTRISGILQHAEAAGRTALAQHLAFETDTSVEAAGGLLKVAAKEAAAEPTKAAESPLERAMSQHAGKGIPSQEVVTDQAKAKGSNLEPNAVFARRAAQRAGK